MKSPAPHLFTPPWLCHVILLLLGRFSFGFPVLNHHGSGGPRHCHAASRSRRRDVAAPTIQSQLPNLPSRPGSVPKGSMRSAGPRRQTSLQCQLLGMNCAGPTRISMHWEGFCDRGGRSDIHADGWGLAYYPSSSNHDDAGGLRQFHDVQAASTSPLARFLGEQPLETRNMLAHIRYATAGKVNLSNVHPFSRELWGNQFCFCHNGQVPLILEHPETWLGEDSHESDDENHLRRVYTPVGDTDSEAIFCAILNALRYKFRDTMPSLPVLYQELQRICTKIVAYESSSDVTIFNFLLTCGPHVLWAYSWPGRRPGSDVWNGLYYCVRGSEECTVDNDNEDGNDDELELYDLDYSVNIQACEEENNRVCVVATTPLTSDEEWVEFKPGDLLVLDEGMPRVSPQDLFRVELSGHGLQNSGPLQPVRLEEDMRRFHFRPEFFAGGGI